MEKGELSRYLKSGTFSEWNAAMEKVQSEFFFDVQNGNRAQLREEGFSTFHYWIFDGVDEERKKTKEFFDRYGFVIAILYPKNSHGNQPYRQCRDWDMLERFLEENSPLDRFRMTLGQQKETQYGGTIISEDGFVLCELGEGRQDLLAHGGCKEIYNARCAWGLSPIFSENNTDETRKLITNALRFVGNGRNYLPCYLEFFCCDGDIYFTDYKKSGKFRRKINEVVLG